MCGRLNLSDLDGIRRMMAQIGMPLYSENAPKRYNVAPSSDIQVLCKANSELGFQTPGWTTAHWGMAVQTKDSSRLVINARSETVTRKPLFRRLIAEQRVLVPATGFYEWLRHGRSRKAFHFSSCSDAALLMAGVWRRNASQGLEAAILTTSANADISHIHDRMPLLLEPDAATAWLSDGDSWQTLMTTPRAGLIRAIPVASHVNDASHDSPACLDPPDAEPHTPDLFGS